MLNIEAFTDRREAIALFETLRGYDSNKRWPLLPILAFIAPGGSGKSTLIEYLQKRCLSNGRPAVPYAYLDFTLTSTPKDLLSIMINLRDQLQRIDDGQGKHLTFPRFDLGAFIAQAAQAQEDPSSLAPNQVRGRLAEGKQVFQSLSTLSGALGFAVPYVAPLLAGLNLAGQIKPVRDILLSLENRSGWQWYRMHGTETGLGANAKIEQVLLQLHAMSMPGKPERDYLLGHLLPAAFLADLLDALVYSDPPPAWNKAVNVVLFLDGFEDLLASSGTSTTAIQLLEVLALSEHRERGETDPLLLVLGSRERLLLEFADVDQEPPFEVQTEVQSEQAVQEHVQDIYRRWQQKLPGDSSVLRLDDLYLPLWLHDFGEVDTHRYVSKIDEQEHTQAFTDHTLLRAIHHATLGHPLALALAAAVVVEAQKRGQGIHPDEFLRAPVPRKVKPGHGDERIEKYLLDLFLRQLPESEQDQLISCAVPRFLDVAILQAILELPGDNEARDRWQRYRHLTFMRAIDNERIVIHPIVRELLLGRLLPGHEPESRYSRLHTRLRDHFHKRASEQITSLSQRIGDWQAQVEEAYHALALGDPEPAIATGIVAQQVNLTLWEPLLEAVAQAPTERLPVDIEQQAEDALVRAERYRTIEDGMRAIVLYRWLITASQGLLLKIARFQHNLGTAYWNLPGGDLQANLKRAISCFEAALQVCTPEAFPMQWAMTQNNLGNAYSDLPGGDRQANLKRAIACFEAALKVYTSEAFPSDWAMTQNNLGAAYANLPGEDRQANLKQAITCFEAALQVRTREAFPVDWAMTQNNLGNAYANLPGGDRLANLKQAIACFEAALEVRTREAFPADWAMTQNNLGTAYDNLPGGDRRANLKRAIACFEAALQVHTREAFPADWAMTQNNLGNVYRNLPGGDRRANLKQAITCFEVALHIYTHEAFPVDWATTQNNLGIAYANLPGGDRQANLKQAIACFEAALQVRTREAFPSDWATTQNNLGAAYANLPGEDRQANLKQAIACYEAALQVRTREAFPADWATTQNNLGEAYRDLPVGDRQANLKRAIACYEAALQTFRLVRIDFNVQVVSRNLERAKGDLENLKQD